MFNILSLLQITNEYGNNRKNKGGCVDDDKLKTLGYKSNRNLMG